MGKVEVRKQNLLDLLQEKEKLSVDEICARYQISPPQARKMCAALAGEGKVIRIHGGIQRLPKEQSDYLFERLVNKSLKEKERIGLYAASLIESHKTVFLEAGTTVLQCVYAFAERIKNNELTNVTVFTNSLRNLEVLHKVCQVNLIGGRYRDERKDFTGYMSELALKDLHFDYCFFGADAISLSNGVMGMDIDTVRFGKELVRHSEQVIVLAHYEKLYRNSLLPITPLENVSYIITDEGVEDDLYNRYRKMNVGIVRV